MRGGGGPGTPDFGWRNMWTAPFFFFAFFSSQIAITGTAGILFLWIRNGIVLVYQSHNFYLFCTDIFLPWRSTFFFHSGTFLDFLLDCWRSFEMWSVFFSSGSCLPNYEIEFVKNRPGPESFEYFSFYRLNLPEENWSNIVEIFLPKKYKPFPIKSFTKNLSQLIFPSQQRFRCKDRY